MGTKCHEGEGTSKLHRNHFEGAVRRTLEWEIREESFIILAAMPSVHEYVARRCLARSDILRITITHYELHFFALLFQKHHLESPHPVTQPACPAAPAHRRSATCGSAPAARHAAGTGCAGKRTAWPPANRHRTIW